MQKIPAADSRLWNVAVLLTQTSSAGGAVQTDVTEVAVMPCHPSLSAQVWVYRLLRRLMCFPAQRPLNATTVQICTMPAGRRQN
jgi:hypothetical protein